MSIQFQDFLAAALVKLVEQWDERLGCQYNSRIFWPQRLLSLWSNGMKGWNAIQLLGFPAAALVKLAEQQKNGTVL